MEKESKLPTPPYVAFKTLKNSSQNIKQSVPSRIDRDLMGSMSGAAQSQVTTALKYLGFISESNLTLDKLRNYATATEDEQKALLKQTLVDSYPFIFHNGFDLSSATASQLRESFEAHTSARGETVGRCIAFFKDAAQEAGIGVSPFITQKKSRGGAPRKRSVSVAKQVIPPVAENRQPPNLHFNEHPSHPTIEAQSSLLLWGLFQRLPKPGSVWPKEQRDQWTQTLNNVLGLEYKEQ